MHDDDAYNLREVFEELELELIENMKRNLARHDREEEKEGFRWEMWQKAKLRRLKEFREENQRLVEGSQKRIHKTIKDTIKSAWEKGANVIKSLLKKVSIMFPKGNISPLGQEPPPDNDFFGINRKRIEVLQQEAKSPDLGIEKQVQGDIDRASSAMWRRMDDVYRQTIYKAGMFLNAGGMSLNQAIDQATKDFLVKGIDCIEYKNGNRVNIASYAEMALRTASHRAVLAAEGKERDRLGIHTVIVTAHANTCELCAPWQAKILVDDVFSSGTAEEARELGYPLLSEAIKAGLLHPNCRHTITTYIPSVTQIPKIPDPKKAAETYKVEQKQRELERKVVKWKRIAEGSLDDQNIQYAKKKVREYQTELRELLKAHPELRRAYSREKTRGISQNVLQRKAVNDTIKLQLTSSNGIKITGISKHAFERMEERGVSMEGIIDSLQNPLNVSSIRIDSNGMKSQRFIGNDVTTNINPDNGNIITTWRTGERARKRAGGHK